LYAGKIEGDGRSIVIRKTQSARGHYILPAAFPGGEIALHGSPGAGHTGFASGVRKLHSGTYPLLVKKVDDPAQAGDVFVLPKA
jgi:hypothetical protein